MPVNTMMEASVGSGAAPQMSKTSEERVPSSEICLPDEYEPLPHQVAGHLFTNGKLGLLRRRGDRTAVLKPVQRYPKGPRELEFYQRVFGSQGDSELGSFQAWVPRYCGVTDILMSDGLGKRQQTFLLLEDQAAMLHQASVIDVKIGRKCWDHEASPQKIEAELSKYPLQEHLGYRLSAMRVFDRVEEEFQHFSKGFGLSLDASDVLDALSKFFWDGTERRGDVIREILSQLQSLLAVFQSQTEVHFYSSSLLILYDSQQPASAASVKVKMIDFAHTFFVAAEHRSIDENYIFGLTHFIEGLKTLL